MTTIAVQMGHVARRSGATGTAREQEFATAVGRALQPELNQRGHRVYLIGADDPVPRCDVFIALHCDGSLNPDRRGASIGYPDAMGGVLAHAWQAAHSLHGFPGGFLPDNYTAALRGYYGFGRAKGARYRFLAEHGTTTNEDDRGWLFGHVREAVRAHVDAIGAVIGHPIPELTGQPGIDAQGEPDMAHDTQVVTPIPPDGNAYLDDGYQLRWIQSPEEGAELLARYGQKEPMPQYAVHLRERRRFEGPYPPATNAFGGPSMFEARG